MRRLSEVEELSKIQGIFEAIGGQAGI